MRRAIYTTFAKGELKKSDQERLWLNNDAEGNSNSKNDVYDGSVENYKLENLGGNVVSLVVTLWLAFTKWVSHINQSLEKNLTLCRKSLKYNQKPQF